jgi:hypothetical protein
MRTNLIKLARSLALPGGKSMSGCLKSLALAALASLLMSQASKASPPHLISTLNSTPGNVWGIGADAFSLAQQFTTGSQSETIGSVSVSIANAWPASDFTVSFYSNASGTPGSLLSNGLLSGPSTPTSDVINLYGASGLTLNANTTYWLVFENPAATYVSIRNTDSGGVLNTSSSAGWTLGNTDYKIFNGGSYASYPNAVPLFSIDITPVPEPTTLVLAGLGGLSLLLMRRKK